MATTPAKKKPGKQPQDRQSKRIAPKAAPKAVTTAAAWKKGTTGDPLETDLEVPSGNVARVRRRPMDALVSAGVIPNALMAIVEESIGTGTVPDIKLEDMDQEMMEAVVELIDAVTVYAVVQPPLAPLPQLGEERDPDRLYVDDVDMTDKLFIFQFVVGGTDDLEQFRQEQAAGLESVSPG